MLGIITLGSITHSGYRILGLVISTYIIPVLLQFQWPDLPLLPIISDHFTTTTLPNKMTLKEFQKDNGVSNEESVHNVFVEWDNIPIENGLMDVILKNKVSIGFRRSD